MDIDIKALLFWNRKQMEEHKKAIDKLSHARVNLIKKATKEGMSVTNVANNLGISRQRVYKIIKQGRK
jgi:DNA invertase Pin-like site-specific DNA recombinase